nr:hypothetical protein GCM10020092_020570 [Actinoplanes digitatis]
MRIAFHGRLRRLDLGVLNGEHFAVMAGIGFDGAMIQDADGRLKERMGKLAYVWTGLRHLDDPAPRAKIKVDGTRWFSDEASCVLVGNVGMVTGGITAFDDARPDDGWLDVGVATARGATQWARTMGQMAVGRSEDSPYVRMTRARRIDVRLAEPLRYELDGGAREAARRIRIDVALSRRQDLCPGRRTGRTIEGVCGTPGQAKFAACPGCPGLARGGRT